MMSSTMRTSGEERVTSDDWRRLITGDLFAFASGGILRFDPIELRNTFGRSVFEGSDFIRLVDGESTVPE